MRQFMTALALCTGLVLCGQAGADAAGINAFRAGDYGTALLHFDAAYKAGDRSPRLIYNLAVTHYQLGNDDQALSLFRRLRSYPEWVELAEYNIRIISGKDVSKAPEATSGDGVLSFAAGYDSNALAFADELTDGSTFGSDAYTELLALGRINVNAVRLSGFLYNRRHSDFDFLDGTAFGAGIDHVSTLGGWRLETGVGAGQSSVDGDTVTSDFNLNLVATRRFDNSEVRVALRPARYSGGAGYEYLDGNAVRIDARLRHRVDNLRLGLLYRFERQDRADRETDTEFFSHSPTTHRFGGEVDWMPTGKWSLGGGFAFASSQFRGINRLLDLDDVVREAQRESDRMEAWVRIERAFTDRLAFAAEVRMTDTDDTFLYYQYSRWSAQAGIQFSF